jgi:hypothetical protein
VFHLLAHTMQHVTKHLVVINDQNICHNILNISFIVYQYQPH